MPIDSCITNYLNLTNDTNSIFNQLSIETMKKQKLAFIMWIFTAFFNLVSAFITFLVIRKNKHLQNDTQTLLMQSNMAVCVCSVSFACGASVHLRNILKNLPEATCRYRCFLMIGHQTLFMSTSNSFILSITVDR